GLNGTQVGYRAGQRYAPRLVRAAAAGAVQRGAAEVNSEATYLITGGMGGLGLKVASSLVSKGAKHLLLTGRREPSDEAVKAIEQLREGGAEVHWQLADVGQAEDVHSLLAAPERLGWPALKGIVHAAGVLDDGVLSNQSWERFERVMRSKVMGARNLSDAAKGLDFFVLFSSASAVVGAPGQGNYAAANAYLDGLAQAGRAKGERWLSINWGAWAEVGLAAERAWELNAIGIGSMKPEQALEAMWRVVEHEEAVAQVIIIQVDWSKYVKRLPNSPMSVLLKSLISLDVKTDPQQEQLRKLLAGQAGRTKLPQEEPRKLLMQLEAAPEHERFDLLVAYIRGLTAQVIRLDSPQSIDPDKNFLEIGLDSLTGLEIRNRLEVALGMTLPAQMFWEYPTLNQLAAHLCDYIKKPSGAGVEGASGNGHHPPESEEQQLSADQAEALSKLLNEIESIS
ncbi:MAG TPA: beta-ketoacyl reductase, partial [Pyrinomonadaceae bacterium]